jgi:hypothetical protein
MNAPFLGGLMNDFAYMGYMCGSGGQNPPICKNCEFFDESKCVDSEDGFHTVRTTRLCLSPGCEQLNLVTGEKSYPTCEEARSATGSCKAIGGLFQPKTNSKTES